MARESQARQKIIDAALTVIRTRGYAATSVDDLCSTAGVTKGAFFHHFRSKEDLAVQADPMGDNSDLLKRYPKAATVPGDGRVVTELDALVAYLQVLGTMVDFADPANEKLHQ